MIAARNPLIERMIPLRWLATSSDICPDTLARTSPKPPTLVADESGCFNIAGVESRLPLRTTLKRGGSVGLLGRKDVADVGFPTHESESPLRLHISFTVERSTARAFNGRCDMATRLEPTDGRSSVAAPEGGTMKAVVQEGTGSADVLHLREVDRPTLTDDRVLIRVRAASVNALDWHTTHGGFLLNVISMLTRQKNLPIRGVDVAGVVEAVGKNVTGLQPGDEVFGLGRGTFAEYASCLERGLLQKPKELSFTQAAAVGVAGLTALQGLRDKGQLRPGQRVLIHGAGGGVGTFAVQIAKALGAHVTAVTGPKNVDLVRALGPDEIIDYTKEDVTRRAQRYDVVFDVAAKRPIGTMRRVLTPNGMFVQAGASKSGWLAVFGRILALVVRSRVLGQRVVMYISTTSRADLAVLRELIEAGKLRPVIDRAFPLTEAAEAVRYVGSGQARAKVVITID